jgi:hypothetical protein
LLLATKNESPSRYCFRWMSWFSNWVLSVFTRTSRDNFFFLKTLDIKVWEGFFTWSSSWHDRWNLECIKNKNQIHVQRWRSRNDVVAQLNRQNDIPRTMIPARTRGGAFVFGKKLRKMIGRWKQKYGDHIRWWDSRGSSQNQPYPQESRHRITGSTFLPIFGVILAYNRRIEWNFLDFSFRFFFFRDYLTLLRKRVECIPISLYTPKFYY